MRPPLVAIFFMTYFHRARGAMAPWIHYCCCLGCLPRAEVTPGRVSAKGCTPPPHGQFLTHACETRMHSSRMHTIHCSGCLLPCMPPAMHTPLCHTCTPLPCMSPFTTHTTLLPHMPPSPQMAPSPHAHVITDAPFTTHAPSPCTPPTTHAPTPHGQNERRL